MGISIPPVPPDGPINSMRRLAGALHYWERRQEISANNIANVNTGGFKGERVFARLMGEAIPMAQATRDLSAGQLTPTDNPLDLALAGNGFFVVRTPQGERLARGGAFALDAERRVTLADGSLLLGEEGPIVVPEGATHVAIDRAGLVTVELDVAGGQPVRTTLDRLRVETVADPQTLQHTGGTLFAAQGPTRVLALDERGVRQGMLEESNVNPVDGLVDMVTVARTFQSVQTAAKTLDEVRGVISSELGRPV